MDSMRKLWLGLALVSCLSFAALGWLGRETCLAAPPVPERVRTADGETLYSGERQELSRKGRD
jgi:nitric oxide reductase subunit B